MAINEDMLKDALVALAEQCKQQFSELAAVVNEVAALHKTVLQLEPNFSDVLDQQKKLPKSIEARTLAIERLDEIIRRLKTDVIHR